jgi:serine/threonine protein kinase
LKATVEERIGRYELLIELARGGMAELFLGRLHGAGGFAKLVAIKRILPHLAQDKQFKEMFLNEGRIAANLSHPNVCQVFELDEVEGELFLAMEYLDGVSWDQLVREIAPGNFAMRLSIGIIAQACEGLHYAHALRDVEGNTISIVHRDVSPQNLFVTVDGVCKVLDFGVSKVMADGPRTRSGVIKGKLPYMAPEQIRGEPLDGRADIFALGVCIWEALTAQRLYDRPSDFMIWKAITEEDVAPITTHWPECPPALDAVVRRALDRDRDKRFATARDFADALRAAAGLLPCSLAEIAEAVKARCGHAILERQRQVATAVSAKRSILDLDTAETQERHVASSMELRQESVTLDLRREAKRLGIDDDAAPTRDLRRDAAETRTVVPPPVDDVDEPAPHRSNLRLTIIVAVLAAAITAAVVVTVMMMNQHDAPAAAPAPQQPIVPSININVTQPPADAAEPAIAIDAAPLVTETKKPGKRSTAKKPPAPTTEPATEESAGSGSQKDFVEEMNDAAEKARKAGDDLQKMGDQIRKDFGR